MARVECLHEVLLDLLYQQRVNPMLELSYGYPQRDQDLHRMIAYLVTPPPGKTKISAWFAKGSRERADDRNYAVGGGNDRRA